MQVFGGVGQGTALETFRQELEDEFYFALCVGGCANASWQDVGEVGSGGAATCCCYVRQFHLRGFRR